MRRVLFVTQVADPAHPVLGATMPKIRELAKRVDEVVVFAARVDRAALPENCRAHVYAAPTQALRGARYLSTLAPELARRPNAVVAHMAPVFALLAAPLTKPLRVPLLLWFTGHASSGRLLDAAEHVVDAIFSVDERRCRAPRGRCARSATGSTSTRSLAWASGRRRSAASSASGAMRR